MTIDQSSLYEALYNSLGEVVSNKHSCHSHDCCIQGMIVVFCYMI